MWIKRDISSKIRELVSKRPAVLLTGARQTGKTSVLRHLFPQAEYVSFDWPANADEAENNPVEFLSRFKGSVILDEIQYVPSLFRHLKIWIDENRHITGKWILTGSQKFHLMKEVSESLAGRISILELDTLSANEIRVNKLDLEQYLLKGGFPEIWANPNIDSEQFFQDYVLTYLERDLKKLLQVSDLRAFDRFIRSMSLRVGQLCNFSQTSKDAGITSVTGKKWFDVLQASNIFSVLEPYFNNQLNRLVKSPKVYLKDQGLLNFLLNIHSKEEMRNSHYYGALYENFVFNEISRQAELHNFKKSLFFLRDKNNLEVDFLIEKGDTIKLIEVKTSEYPKEALVNLNKIKLLLDSKYNVELFIACQIVSDTPQHIQNCTFYNPLKYQMTW
ncbi:MAG: ATP-binding protein [Thiohalomonadales bacterium]